jgi:GxxExxY protein
MKPCLHGEETYSILGACFNVYKEMGCGFLEAVYQECLTLEFKGQGIPFREQAELKIEYKDMKLRQTYKPDFICYDKIILELKSLSALNNEHEAQLFNYLKASGYRVGLLANFGHYPKLEYKRIII